MNKKLIIGSRGSKLALWQADYLQNKLKETGYESEIKIIKTKGDNIQNLGFAKMEGKGFFTKELEEELLSEKIDVAVHSMKDLQTSHPDKLVIAGVSYREDPADIIIIHKDHYDEHAPMNIAPGTVVGTSSARRKAMLNDLLDEVNIKDIRGNVPTRVEKLYTDDYGAVVLAAAGVKRLNLQIKDAVVKRLHPKEFIPAPAQGVLAYQTREEDIALRKIIKSIHNPEVARLTNVERSVLKRLDGGCQLPLGVYVEKDANGYYSAHAALYREEHKRVKRVSLAQSTTAGMADKIYDELTKS